MNNLDLTKRSTAPKQSPAVWLLNKQKQKHRFKKERGLQNILQVGPLDRVLKYTYDLRSDTVGPTDRADKS